MAGRNTEYLERTETEQGLTQEIPFTNGFFLFQAGIAVGFILLCIYNKRIRRWIRKVGS